MCLADVSLSLFSLSYHTNLVCAQTTDMPSPTMPPPPSSSSSSAPFSIQPVVAADLPALAALCGASMAADRHTQLKAAHPTAPYDHAAGMLGALAAWLAAAPAQRVDFVKAVEDDTGRILGFVCWGLRLGEEEEGTAARDDPPQQPEEKEDGQEEDGHDDPLAQLDAFTTAHLADYQTRVAARRGPRCMYVMTIAVDPRHQGRGVGTALLRHGTDRADGSNVFCWVHASEAGAAAFRAAGFAPDEVLRVDLDATAGRMGIPPPAGQDRWGTYTFTYMVREPQGGGHSPPLGSTQNVDRRLASPLSLLWTLDRER